MPEHPPPVHPVNTEPLAAVAVNVIRADSAKSYVQVSPHAMPSGLLVTVPLPAPSLGDGECKGR